MSRTPRTYYILPLIPLLWGFNVVAARVAMLEIHPAWGAFLRFSIALVLYLLVLRRIPQLTPFPLYLLLAVTGVAGFNLLLFWGIRLAAATDAAVISAVYPLTVALVHAGWFRQRLPLPIVLGIVVSGIGVVVLTLGHATASPGNTEDQRILGDILLLCAALSWGVYSTAMTIATSQRAPLEVTAGTIFLGVLLLSPIALSAPFPSPDVSLRAWSGLLYIAIGGSFAAFALWSHVLSKLPASTVAPILNGTPVVALLASVLLLDKHLMFSDFMGIVLVFAGVLYAQITGFRQRQRLKECPSCLS